MISDDGRLLVDGGVVDNIPLGSMSALKTGPNLVAHFGLRGRAQRFEVDYMSIPGRWQLARSLLTRTGRGRLPPIPGPIGVLQRCLVLNQDPDRLPTGPLDLVLPVPELPGATLLDFDRHFEVFEGAYQWCNAAHRRARRAGRSGAGRDPGDTGLGRRSSRRSPDGA